MSDNLLQKPTPWTNYCPKDYADILKILRALKIDILPLSEPIPEPKNPLRLNSLRNRILVEKSRLRNAPIGYKTYAYLNDSGNWSGICTSPENLFNACQEVGITCDVIDGKFRMPDYLMNIQIDPDALNKTISQASEMDAKAGRAIDRRNAQAIRTHREIIYLCGNMKGEWYGGATSEELIMARYAKLLIKKACKHAIEDWASFPKEYMQIHEYICLNKNQWTTEHSEGIEYKKFTEDPELKPESPETWTLLTKVNRPNFCREPENQNRKTFDFIEMRFGLRSKDALKDRSKLVKTCMRDIIKISYQKIKQSQQFQRYGVPIQFLKPTKYGVTDQDELVITFELRTDKKGVRPK